MGTNMECLLDLRLDMQYPVNAIITPVSTPHVVAIIIKGKEIIMMPVIGIIIYCDPIKVVLEGVEVHEEDSIVCDVSTNLVSKRIGP